MQKTLVSISAIPWIFPNTHITHTHTQRFPNARIFFSFVAAFISAYMTSLRYVSHLQPQQQHTPMAHASLWRMKQFIKMVNEMMPFNSSIFMWYRKRCMPQTLLPYTHLHYLLILFMFFIFCLGEFKLICMCINYRLHFVIFVSASNNKTTWILYECTQRWMEWSGAKGAESGYTRRQKCKQNT